MGGAASKRARAGAAPGATTAPKRPTGHAWHWGMEANNMVRRTALVVVQWVEGRDGPFVMTGSSRPLLATFSFCSLCGFLCAEIELSEGRPPLRAYGVDADSLVIGSGAPRCEPGELVRGWVGAGGGASP